jgi:hypothetical protein
MLASVLLIFVLGRHGGRVWRRRGVQSKVVLVAVLSAPPVALTIVVGNFNLGQEAVSTPDPIPPGSVTITALPRI